MELSKTRASDSESLEDGVWRDHPHYPELEIRVRSINCEPYRKAIRRIQNQENPRKYWRSKIGDQNALAVETRMKATPNLLTDWRGKNGKPGITEDGQEIKYSPEFVLRLCDEWVADHQSHSKFFDGIIEVADDIAAEETAAREESLGN